MALHLQASMDALVVSRSLRALLAFAQSSIASTRGDASALESTAIGEMLVGSPLERLPPPWHSPKMRCLLAEVVPLTSERHRDDHWLRPPWSQIFRLEARCFQHHSG